MTARYFKYVGTPVLTRGDYGVGVVGGHTTERDPDYITVFDPDFGDSVWISIDAGLASGEWIETSFEEWTEIH